MCCITKQFKDEASTKKWIENRTSRAGSYDYQKCICVDSLNEMIGPLNYHYIR